MKKKKIKSLTYSSLHVTVRKGKERMMECLLLFLLCYSGMDLRGEEFVFYLYNLARSLHLVITHTFKEVDETSPISNTSHDDYFYAK